MTPNHKKGQRLREEQMLFQKFKPCSPARIIIEADNHIEHIEKQIRLKSLHSRNIDQKNRNYTAAFNLKEIVENQIQLRENLQNNYNILDMLIGRRHQP